MSDDRNRVVTYLSDELLDALTATNEEMLRIHNIGISKTEAIRLGVLCYVRSVLKVTEKKKILTIGDIEQALVAHIRKRSSDN